MDFFERTGKERYARPKASLQFEKARKTNSTYVIPAYNLSQLQPPRPESSPAPGSTFALFRSESRGGRRRCSKR